MIRRLIVAAVLTATCLLPGKLQAQVSAVPSTPATLDVAARREVASTFARALRDDYAHPDIGAKMAVLIEKKTRQGAYDKLEPFAFAQALRDDARSISSDKHLQVMPSAPGPGPGPGSRDGGAAAEIRRMNGAIVEAKILDGNIGYLVINGVPPLETSKSAIDAAFAFLKNTDALILDLRGNSGGEPTCVAYYMSYLSEGAPHVVNVIHWRKGDREESYSTTDLGNLAYGAKKPVYALTSAWTFSGGEELAYDLKAFRRGVVVGEVTGGGANPGGFHPLGHGFAAFVPVGFAINPVTHTNWEGVGVQPDIPTSADQALVRAHRLAAEAIKTAGGATSPAAIDLVLRKLDAADQPELPSEALVGEYGFVGSGGPRPQVELREKQLYLRIAGRPAVALVPIGQGRYTLSSLPATFQATFVREGSAVKLILEQPGRPMTLLEKQ